MFVFHKVRARNFARAWSLVQMSQSLPGLLGLGLAAATGRPGQILAGAALVAGSGLLFLGTDNKTSIERLQHRPFAAYICTV